MSLKTAYERAKKSRAESTAFKKIIAKRNLQARRKAYADESLVQAKKKGSSMARDKANKVSLGRRLEASVTKRLLTPKKAPKRIPIVKRKSKRAKRVKVKGKAPIKRTKKVIVRRETPDYNPFSQSIDTGYRG